MEQLPDSFDDLCDAILALRTRDEVAAFLRDACTLPSSRRSATGWPSARLLDSGMPYAEVAERVGTAPRPRSRASPTGCGTARAATGSRSTGSRQRGAG